MSVFLKIQSKASDVIFTLKHIACLLLFIMVKGIQLLFGHLDSNNANNADMMPPTFAILNIARLSISSDIIGLLSSRKQ